MTFWHFDILTFWHLAIWTFQHLGPAWARNSTLHDSTLRCSTLLDLTWRYLTLIDATWRYSRCSTLRCSTLLNTARRYSTLLDAAERYSMLRDGSLGRQTWPLFLFFSLAKKDLKSCGGSLETPNCFWLWRIIVRSYRAPPSRYTTSRVFIYHVYS
jgi:hypothetical protein